MDPCTNFINQVHNEAELLRDIIEDILRYVALSKNSINKLSKKDFNISEITKICINLNKKTARLAKKEYEIWIMSCALTHILETFTNFTVRVIKLITLNKLEIAMSKEEEKNLIGSKKSIAEKLKILQKIMVDNYSKKVPLSIISKDHINALESIRKARNCMVHYHGVVEKKHTSESSGFFELQWFYNKDYFILANGKKVDAKKRNTHKEIIDFLSENGCYSKKFKLNSTINIRPKELYQIGMFIIFLCSSISTNLRKLFHYNYPDDILIFKS